MKNPAWQEPGATKPQGAHEGIVPSGPDNKYAPGDPGITGQTDVNWASVAPIRFARKSIAATRHLFGNFSD